MHINMSVYVLLQFQCREWVLFSVVAGASNEVFFFFFFCISECTPSAAVTFSIFSLQWQFSPLTFYSSSSLVALTVTFWEKFWSLLSKSCIWSFFFLIFFFFITRSISVLNIADLFQGKIWLDVIQYSVNIPFTSYILKLFVSWHESWHRHSFKNLQKSNPDHRRTA